VSFVQKVSDRGRQPFPAAARWSLPNLIQLRSNTTKGQFGIGDGDRRHQLHQMIFWRVAR
jgi:hypothetical protein